MKRYTWTIKCISCGKSKQACRKTAKYCNARCQVTYEYASGLRDKATIADAAHDAVRGRKFPNKRRAILSPEALALKGARISATKTGRPVPKLRGCNNSRWRGGKNTTIWKSPEYQAWRKAVFRRDGYKCVLCGDARGGNLEADHIKPRYTHPELTFDTTNGRTLCKPCHRATPTWGWKVKTA